MSHHHPHHLFFQLSTVADKGLQGQTTHWTLYFAPCLISPGNVAPPQHAGPLSPARQPPVSSSDAARGLDVGDSAGVSEPLLDLLDAVFELQTRGFFHRRVCDTYMIKATYLIPVCRVLLGAFQSVLTHFHTHFTAFENAGLTQRNCNTKTDKQTDRHTDRECIESVCMHSITARGMYVVCTYLQPQSVRCKLTNLSHTCKLVPGC